MYKRSWDVSRWRKEDLTMVAIGFNGGTINEDRKELLKAVGDSE